MKQKHTFASFINVSEFKFWHNDPIKNVDHYITAFLNIPLPIYILKFIYK